MCDTMRCGKSLCETFLGEQGCPLDCRRSDTTAVQPATYLICVHGHGFYQGFAMPTLKRTVRAGMKRGDHRHLALTHRLAYSRLWLKASGSAGGLKPAVTWPSVETAKKSEAIGGGGANLDASGKARWQIGSRARVSALARPRS